MGRSPVFPTYEDLRGCTAKGKGDEWSAGGSHALELEGWKHCTSHAACPQCDLQGSVEAEQAVAAQGDGCQEMGRVYSTDEETVHQGETEVRAGHGKAYLGYPDAEQAQEQARMAVRAIAFEELMLHQSEASEVGGRASSAGRTTPQRPRTAAPMTPAVRTGARAATVSEQVEPMELELADDPYHLPAPPATPTPPGLPLSGDSRLPAQSRARESASLSEAPRQPIMESSKHMPTPVLGRRGLGEKLQDRRNALLPFGGGAQSAPSTCLLQRLAGKQLEDDGTGQALL